MMPQGDGESGRCPWPGLSRELMNPRIGLLQPYPFQRLAALTARLTPPALPPINMAIGEPRHPAPEFLAHEFGAALAGVAVYPSTRGSRPLREAIAAWFTRRYELPAQALDPDRHVLPSAGSREAITAVIQARIDPTVREQPVVVMPNPFYQIYEGATLLAGAEPYYLPTGPAQGFRMDIDAIPPAILARTQIVLTCSPGNPTGQVLDQGDYERLLALAHQHDFLIAADECYAEIYADEEAPPTGLLGAAYACGVKDFAHCVAIHSLSKRSNLPGLRFGYLGGEATFMERLLTLRTYLGSAPSQLAQLVAIPTLADEAHVRANRAQYRVKFQDAQAILGDVIPITPPPGGFYLWLPIPGDDETFVAGFYAQHNVLALPGSYLSRESGGINPGAGFIRLALVGPREECREGLGRLRTYIESLERSRDVSSSAH